MNRHLKRALAGAGLGTAVVLAGAALAAGSLPNLLPGSTLPTASEPAPAKSQPAPAGAVGTTGAQQAPSPPEALAARARADAVFDQLDTNKDGVLTRDEFAKATIRLQ